MGNSEKSTIEKPELKLAEVRKLLSSVSTTAASSDSAKGKSAKLATSEVLLIADALLGRTNTTFISRASTEKLAQIVVETTACYNRYLQETAPFIVEVKSLTYPGTNRPVTVIVTAMPDRPFIIDTLTELLRTNNITLRVMLHPIIKHDDQRLTSLTYLELNEIDDPGLLLSLQTELRERFIALMSITDDFLPIVKEVEATLATLRDRASSIIAPEVERKETREFLRWLIDGGFLFLGLQIWEGLGDQQTPHLTDSPQLGMFKVKQPRFANLEALLPSAVHNFLTQKTPLQFTRVNTESPVHRYVRMDLVLVKIPGMDGTGPRVLVITGLLTSKAMAQEAASVPIIRRKLHNILQLEGFMPNSHSYKEFLSIANCIPKAELLQYSPEQLSASIQSVMGIQGRTELRVLANPDTLGIFTSVLVALPQQRSSSVIRDRILHLLEKLFATSFASSEYHVTTSDLPLVIHHFLLPLSSDLKEAPSIPTLEREVSEIVVTWDDKLIEQFLGTEEEGKQRRLAAHYCQAFPETYKASVAPQTANEDIVNLESLSAESPLEVTLLKVDHPTDTLRYSLSLYKQGDDLTLSAILPFLENLGFSILNETVTPITLRNGSNAAIYRLSVRPRLAKELDLKQASSVLVPGLKLILSGKADNDQLNELMLFPGLNHREISVLRALTSYLWQIKATTSFQSLASAIVENPIASALLVKYFTTKFDPDLKEEPSSRSEQSGAIRKELLATLASVAQLAHDRSLRQLLNVIDATVRTNFFRTVHETRIALKIESKLIERMPNPRPLVEIFVTAPDFEGVHLRGGRVARGGLRWSDRVDDYRTEVLGLMKTQMVKNAIIVPVGAKGGFVLKNRPTDPKLIPAAVKEAYRRYIRSMLEITDNRVGGEIVHPPRTVIYDNPDPYFVVAADRGTAALSDVANELAISEFNFWLGDAFASGGSNGYDHKKLAITARGVWECVCRHFREIDIDIEQQEFTVAGIGDMSGDVFGNGLLLSKKARLIGAFDHRHVFIDPTPNADLSFAERQRLFQLPHSSWKDYNKELISPGGGVFDRNAKEIALSAEAQQALGIEVAVISGQELIRAVLRAPVDLLWNGGIGTYVKSVDEDNLFVGDRSNDDVRIDAKELRAKIVGEGGNLGFTQRARIEYSRIGGHLNTDAIDNSGGVNTSDLEVNIKILLSIPVARGTMSLAERNSFLLSLADDVCHKVLARNKAQSLAISVGVRRSRKNIGYLKSFIQSLEATGLLDRKGEFLPDDATLDHRIEMKAGLTRPELAVLIGYSKMSLFQTIMASSLPEEPFMVKYLIDYFPQAVGARLKSEILEHPLRREIIATQLANLCVERMGISFVFRASNELGLSQTTVIKCLVAAEAILGGARITSELEVLDRPNSVRQHLLALLRLASTTDQMVRWLVDHRYEPHPIHEIVEKFQASFAELVSKTAAISTASERNRFREATRQFIMNGAARELAESVSSLQYSTVYLDIIDTASICKCPVIGVASLFSLLYQELHIRTLLEHATEFEPTDRWQASAMRMLMADVRRAVAKVGAAIVQQEGAAGEPQLDAFLGSRREMIERFESTYNECRSRPLDVPTLLVLTNQLFSLSRV